MKSKAFRYFYHIVGAFFLLLVTVFTSLEGYAFDLDYYAAQYNELERVNATGMEKEELLRVTEAIMEYLRGERENLELTVEIHGEQTELFTLREIIHMEDVQELFYNGFLLRNGLTIFLLLLLGASPFVMGENIFPAVPRTLYIWAALALGISVILIAVIGVGFNYWFELFHLLSFSNDYWILDPTKHNLIRMFPQKFFYDITIAFVTRSILYLALITFIGKIMVSVTYTFKRKEGGTI